MGKLLWFGVATILGITKMEDWLVVSTPLKHINQLG